MGKAHFNIWLRDEKCIPLNSCWKVDLMIKTCAGPYIYDFDPSIVDQLQIQFPSPDFQISNGGMGSNKVTIFNQNRNQSINHIELQVPPGCYKIKARVCFDRNEDTSEFLAIAKCDDHVCINLLVPEITTCGKAFIHPAAIEALRFNPPHEQVKEFVRLNLLLHKPEHYNLQMLRNEAEERRLEYQDMGETILQPYLQTFVTILDEMLTIQ